MVFGSKLKHSKAQGTMEYMILLSVVAVIALIAVGTTFIVINPVELEKKASVEELKILDISISENFYNNSTGEFIFKLKNNFSSRISISNIKIGDSNSNYDQNLLAGASSIFILSSTVECVNNETIKNMIITFTSKQGLEHLQTVKGVSFICSEASLIQNLRFFYIPNKHLNEGIFSGMSRLSDLNYSLTGEINLNSSLSEELVAYYKFNEDSGTNITDSSGNNYDGVNSNPTGVGITTDGLYTIQTFYSSENFTPTFSGDINVYAWGAGGAGGTVGGWGYGAAGGAGGAANGIVSVTSGQEYSIVVGGGGVVNSTTSAVGGGGAASNNNNDNRYSGGGGGYSGLFLNSVSQANALLIAGGAGGGGSSRAGTGNAGGAGGGTSGQVGYSPYNSKSAYGGNPGTQSAAGANSSCDNISGGGGQGALLGGVTRCHSYGGGGGGGYFGGSGGGYSESNTMGGGGGGSGYFNPSYVSSATLTSGVGTTVADSSNSLRGTAGTAGIVAGNGKSGIVVVKYLTSLGSLTLSNTSTSASGLWGTEGKLFDGTSDCVISTSGYKGPQSVPFSISLWFKTDYNPTSYPMLVSFGQTNGTNVGGIMFHDSWPGILFVYAGQDYILSNKRYDDGEWHQVVFSIDASNFSTLYVDGVLDNSGSLSSNFTAAGPDLSIGCSTWNGYNANFFKGTLEDVAIFNRALLSEEIISLYNFSLNSSYITKSIDTKKTTSIFDSVILNPTSGLSYGTEINPSSESTFSNGLVGLWHLNENSGEAQVIEMQGLNLDFEEGSVGSCPVNWSCSGDALTASPSNAAGCGVAGSGQNGLLYGKAGCDASTGTFTSNTFTLPENIGSVSFLRAGGADGGSGFYVKRASDDAVLCSSEDGTDSDTFFEDSCGGLSSYEGTDAYIQISDNQNSGWGKVYVDNIQFLSSVGFEVIDSSGNGHDGTSNAEKTVSSGVIVTTDGDYTIHTFTQNGTFTPSTNMNVEVLVVGGGGGGGYNAGGGGGAGGVVYNNSLDLSAESYQISIGAGGSGSVGGGVNANRGYDGETSSFSNIIALGGGGGGGRDGGGQSGANGASGGGGAGALDYGNPFGGTGTQGNNGGYGYSDGLNGIYVGAGGGGANENGADATSGGAGKGGDGITNSITGTPTTYGGGGGGGWSIVGSCGQGGSGGGGTCSAGQANTGGGGSGNNSSSNGNNGFSGGSGIVIIKYLTSQGSVTSSSSSNGLWGTNGLTFDGSSAYVYGSDASLPSGNSPRTVSFWAYPTLINSSYHIAFFYGTYSSNAMTEIGIYSGNQWFVSQHGNAVFGNTALTNQWVLITAVYDGSTWYLYENGVETASGAMTTNTVLNQFNIGAENGGSTLFKGNIEELAVWNRALSASEVQDLFSKGTSKVAIQARSCNDSNCTDSNWSSKQYGSSDLKYFTLPRNKYFQFKVTPELIQFTGENIVPESCISQYGANYNDYCGNYFGDYSSCSNYNWHNGACYWYNYGYGNAQWWVYNSPICTGYDSYNYNCNNYNYYCTGSPTYDCSTTDQGTCESLTPYCAWEYGSGYCYNNSCDNWNYDPTTCSNAGCSPGDTCNNSDYLCTWDGYSCSSKAYYYGCSYWIGDSSNCRNSGCIPTYCSNFYDGYYYDDWWNYYPYYYPYYYASGAEAIDYYSNGQCYWYSYSYCDGYPLVCENQLNQGMDSCNAMSSCVYTAPVSETIYKYFINSTPKLTDLNVFYKS